MIDEAERDRLPPVWDMSQERALIESLCGQRFNFFLLVFGAVVAGSINAKTHFNQCTILVIGSVVSFLLYLSLRRLYARLRLIQDHLRRDPTHASTIIHQIARRSDDTWLLSDVIPLVCIVVLFVGTFVALCGFSTMSHFTPMT